MKDVKKEVEDRVKWIKDLLEESGAAGVVFGASGGKDSVLVGILAKMATPNVVGVVMPCESRRNFGMDRDDALTVNEKFGIKTLEVDLTPTKLALSAALKDVIPEQNDLAYMNLNPRLRMATLYNVAQRLNYLVAGTGNRSEIVMGYYTKWGDGASDFNPISDLTVREVYEMLEYLGSPEVIIKKAPSAGLADDQTDEKEMGISYKEIDDYILEGKATDAVREKIEKRYRASAHKRNGVKFYEKHD